jgi:Spy/CpxP family protein refolding chaperone
VSRARLGAVAVVVAAFLVGALAGSAATRAWQDRRFGRAFGPPGGPARERFFVEALSRRLDLSERQRARVEAIFARHRPERDRIFEKCRPAHEALKTRVDGEIREVLTSAQRARFERMLRRRERARPPPPFPP